MEKKCCICGREFNGFGNNANPIREGNCCDYCNSRFVLPIRLSKLTQNKPTYEIAKNLEEFKSLVERLSEKNFEQVGSSSSVVVFKNPETWEKVVICCI